MATALGNQEDVSTYTKLYESLVQQFNAAFYSASSSNYGDLQTEYALPLFLNIVPDLQPLVVQYLNNIVSANTNHLTTGILGTKYLMLTLSDLGRTDIALTLALQTTYPSWGYMIVQTVEVSATTLWELWNSPTGSPSMDSRNHIMFGSIGDWYYKYLAGITQAPLSYGFSNIIIKPPPTAVLLYSPLNSVMATYTSLRGNISVGWVSSGGMICGTAHEGSKLHLNCGENGGTITSIDFASFGQPRVGMCQDYSINDNCHAQSSKKLIETLCVGKPECDIDVTTNLVDIEDNSLCDSYNITNSLAVRATCSAAASYTLGVSLPVGAASNLVYVSKAALSNVAINEGGTNVWSNGQYVPGDSGISAGVDAGAEVVFTVGSGIYDFTVSGSQSPSVCVTNIPENSLATFTCSSGVIQVVKFASFGLPNGSCGSFTTGTCNAGSSAYIVEANCIGMSSCSFNASDTVFGDPCYGTKKNFSAEVLCVV